MTEIRGNYRIVKAAFLREKAGRKDDPRHKFYEAMIDNETYEGYLAQVGQEQVSVPTYKTGPINGRMEILYARRSGWIVDA
jgi:hypothetical protein